MMQTLLHVNGLSKRYGRREVLRSLDLDFCAGEKVLLLGANGSGKSTLLKICAGLLRVEAGAVSPRCDVRHLGFAGHDTLLYGQLSLRENLQLVSTLYGLKCDITSSIARWHLDECADKPLAELSRGQQSRAALCRATVHGPTYLFLDEPTAALDDRSCAQFQTNVTDLMNRSPNGSFCVIATHDVERLISFANRVVWLNNGVIAADSRGLTHSQPCMHVVELYRHGNR